MDDMTKNLTVKWLEEVAMPQVKDMKNNTHKGLIPRFHTVLSDQYYGGTKVALNKACNDLASDGLLVKSFVKFDIDATDVLGAELENGTKEVLSGEHKGMKVGKDGRLSTPIYWLLTDTDIPEWATVDRRDSFRTGEEWFKKQNEDVPM